MIQWNPAEKFYEGGRGKYNDIRHWVILRSQEGAWGCWVHMELSEMGGC